ncbi:hypothetical protein VTN77DRAFT_2240 [Rasamsonia byssochlamydoides]|uniref:uncharacterized protein n=1 Tax=Rasamsonia byssochlamydoides TaxID=89139 RepID=UPI0037447212
MAVTRDRFPVSVKVDRNPLRPTQPIKGIHASISHHQNPSSSQFMAGLKGPMCCCWTPVCPRADSLTDLGNVLGGRSEGDIRYPR